jgi:hypothetical protein
MDVAAGGSKEDHVRGTRVARAAIAAFVIVIAASFSGIADAATPCAWQGQSPCLAKRSQSWFLWGALTNVTPGTDVSINADGFARLSKKINHLLDDEVGNDETVRVQASTRYIVVDSHKHKARVGTDTFWATVDAYDSPTLYVTARLAAGSYWGSDPTNLVASSIVVDLSDLGAVGPDLTGTWQLNGQPATLTALDASNTSYFGQQSGATFTLTISGTSACITNYAYPQVPNNATTFTCGSLAANLQFIGAFPWTSPVWGAGTWTFRR